MSKNFSDSSTYKAVIFDMDGVLLDSEREWHKQESRLFGNIVGFDRYKDIEKELVGTSIAEIYKIFKRNGIVIDEGDYYKKYNKVAKDVYSSASITQGVNEILYELKSMDIKTAVVSASPRSWIDQALSRIQNSNLIDEILSIYDRSDLEPKPAPDSYLEMMRILDVGPNATIIVEDSQVGVKAAKKSRAFTIALTTNTEKEYIPDGADLYIDHLSEILTILIRNKKEDRIT